MNWKNVTTSILVFGLLSAPAALAAKAAKAKGELTSCKSELKKFGCDAKTDEEAFDCLEKHEKERKNGGFSHACYEAHEAYESQTGREESKGK